MKESEVTTYGGKCFCHPYPMNLYLSGWELKYLTMPLWWHTHTKMTLCMSLWKKSIILGSALITRDLDWQLWNMFIFWRFHCPLIPKHGLTRDIIHIVDQLLPSASSMASQSPVFSVALGHNGLQDFGQMRQEKHQHKSTWTRTNISGQWLLTCWRHWIRSCLLQI